MAGKASRSSSGGARAAGRPGRPVAAQPAKQGVKSATAVAAIPSGTGLGGVRAGLPRVRLPRLSALLPRRATASTSQSPKPPTVVRRESSAIKFVRDVRSEIRKVVWPTRQTATNLTILVVVVSIVVGTVLGLVDLAFKSLIERLLGV